MHVHLNWDNFRTFGVNIAFVVPSAAATRWCDLMLMDCLLQVEDPSAFVESFLGSLLEGNVSRPNEIIGTRVRDKVVLLDNPTIGKSRRDRDAESRAVRSLKHMSLREHRRNRTFEIPPELQR